MLLQKITQEIKTKHQGVGPCVESICPHVVDLGQAGESPTKPGPESNISAIAYKSLCTAFETKLRIC